MTNDVALAPLVVDLDGTLIRSDLLVESFFALASSAPLRALRALGALRHGSAALKAAIARNIAIDVATLPYNEELLVWLKAEKARGRSIYIASAAHERYVRAVAEHIGLFTSFFASDAAINLKSGVKAELLCRTFGAGKFDYVGNEKADIPVWQQAAGIVLTNAGAAFERGIKQRFPAAVVIATRRTSRRDYLAALRPHQWLKNLLIFVPAFAAHYFDAVSLAVCALAFVSFSLCASSGYVLNDLLDLGNDRQHPVKKQRPFASGRIDPRHAPRLLVVTLALALISGLFLPAPFLPVLLLYYVLTIVYSTIIKRRMMLDVITLSLLYGIRLVAGGVALGVPLSPWLLSFSSFFFLSLALIKRCSELVTRQNFGGGDPAGRSYRLTDLPILESMAAASGYVAALTSGLYISSTTVTDLYGTPDGLWAVPIILLFWISRIMVLTHRGEMFDDPVLFAARDRVSLLCGTAIVAVIFVSI